MCWAMSVPPGGAARASMRWTAKVRVTSAKDATTGGTRTAKTASVFLAGWSRETAMTFSTCCFPLQQEGALIPTLALQQSIRPTHRIAHESPRPAQGDTTLPRTNPALSIRPVNRRFTIFLYP